MPRSAPPRVPSSPPAYDQGGQATGGDHAAFIRRYLPIAQAYQRQYGISAEALLAIAASESNWGNTPGYALFGMMGSGSAGTVRLGTQTGVQGLAAYKTPNDAFDAFIRTAQASRYATAWQNRADPARFVQGLQAGGYAGNATAEDRNWSNMIAGSMVPQVRTAAQQYGGGTAAAPAQAVPARAATGPSPASTLPRDQQRGWTLPAAGAITSLFGEPFGLDAGRSYQGRAYPHFNAGIDIGAGAGAPVYSLTPGKVISAGPTSDGWGYAVRVQDPDGRIHNYGHTANARVQVGQTVAPGTPLAQVGAGQVGTSTGPHLSYDIWDADGSPVDPTPFLTQGGRGASAVHPTVANDPSKVRQPSYLSRPGGTAMSTPQRPVQPNISSSQRTTSTVNSGTGASRSGANPSAYQEFVASAWEDVRQGQQQIKDLNAQLATANRTPGPAGKDGLPGPSEYDNINSQIQVVQERVNAALKNATDAEKVAGTRKDVVSDNVAAQANATNAKLPYEIAGMNTAQSVAIQNAGNQGVDTAAGLLDKINAAVQTMFSDDLNTMKAVDDVLTSSVSRYINQQQLKIQKGQVDVQAAMSNITAFAAAQTAQVAYAAQAAKNAGYISDENWKRAERLLPAGTENQPGFGPNSPMAQSQRQLGITPEVIKTNPLPPGWNDPEQNLLRGAWVNDKMGWQNPAQAFAGPLAQVQQQTNNVINTPLDPYSAPAGFESALRVPSTPNLDPNQYWNAFNQWQAGGFDPNVPAGPAGVDPNAVADNGTLPPAEEPQPTDPNQPHGNPNTFSTLDQHARGGMVGYADGGAVPWQFLYGREFAPPVPGYDSGLRFLHAGDAEAAGFMPGGQVPIQQQINNGVNPNDLTGNPGHYAYGGQVPQYAAGGQNPGSPWVWNPGRRRWEQQQAGPDGRMRVLRAVIDPTLDNSDLAGVDTFPVPQQLQGRLRYDDPDSVAARQAYAQTLQGTQNRLDGGQAPAPDSSGGQGQQQQGYGGVRMAPADIIAQVHRINSGLDARQALDALNQAEHQLAQEMRGRGVDAGYFQQQYGGAPPAAAGQTEAPGPGILFDPAYVEAMTAQDASAVKAALLARTERLQQMANAWEATKTGGDRLQQYGDAIRTQRSSQAEMDAAEQQLNADSGQDKNLRYDARGNWVHSQNMGANNALAAGQQSINQMQQQYWPNEYQAQQREQMRHVARSGGAVHPSWGLDPQGNDVPGFAYGGQIPRFADGGYSYLGGTGTPGWNGQVTPTSATPTTGETSANFQGESEYYRQQGVSRDLEGQGLERQLQQIETEKNQRISEIQQRAAQQLAGIQSQYQIVQQDIANRQAGLGQQAGVAQGQIQINPYTARGGTPYAA